MDVVVLFLLLGLQPVNILNGIGQLEIDSLQLLYQLVILHQQRFPQIVKLLSLGLQLLPSLLFILGLLLHVHLFSLVQLLLHQTPHVLNLGCLFLNHLPILPLQLSLDLIHFRLAILIQ